MTHFVACMVVLRTDDARLCPDRLDGRTEASRDGLREAVDAALRKGDHAAIVAVMPIAEARLMIEAHQIASSEAGFPVNLVQPEGKPH